MGRRTRLAGGARLAAAGLAAAVALLVATAGPGCWLGLRDGGSVLGCVGRRASAALGMALTALGTAAYIGFLCVAVPVALVSGAARAPAWAVACVAAGAGLWAVYWFRYHHEAPWRARGSGGGGGPGSGSGSGNAKGASRFDLHPDVVGGDGGEEASYVSSLEARSRGPGAMGPAAGGIGFPADFLNMFMKSISIFGYIEEPVFHEFSRQLQTRRLLAGERMFEGEGDRDDQSFYVVIDGQVQIYLVDSASGPLPPPAGPASPGTSGAGTPCAGSWPESYSDFGDLLHAEPGAQPGGPGSDAASDAGSDAGGSSGGADVDGNDSSEALLLNVVGPGDVLSSLLSILSLFAEGVPLRQGGSRGRSRSRSRSQSRSASPPGLHASQLAGSDARGLRPNVVARAATDTTLAAIPASAFQRVTRLYPKAAAHILQVILTRLQRVTFATLYDYLSLPDELVAIERAISSLARLPLAPEIAHSTTLQRLRALGPGEDPDPRPDHAARPSPPSAHPAAIGGSRRLPAAWRISREGLERLERHAPPGLASGATPGDWALDPGGGDPQALRPPLRRHRRTGSDSGPASAAPPAMDVESLRQDALRQLCASLGIDPHTADGCPAAQARDGTPPPASPGSARASRRPSTHRRAHPPRTEYLLPLLQSAGLAEQRQRLGAARPTPLEYLSSLTSEFDLYRVPDGEALVQQGQRPPGLFVVLDGRVEITHRESVSDFTGMDRNGERPLVAGTGSNGGGGSGRPAARTVSEVTRQMTLLALDARSRLDSRPPAGSGTAAATAAGPQAAAAQAAEPADSRDRARRLRPYSVGAGSVVGYMAALTDMASLYTARSRGGAVVGLLTHWALERMAERYPVVLMALARRLTSRLPAAILSIDYALEWVQVRASQMVHRQGERSDAAYVVLSGRLRAFAERPGGGIAILAEFGQGQSVGEPGLLLREPCAFSLHAIRDTELVRIPRALFTALMRSAPALTLRLSQTLAVRTTQSLQREQLMAAQAPPPPTWPREAGIRSHNKNLKSVALIPVSDHVPIRAFAEQLEAALAGIAGRVALLDHTAMSRVLGRHAFSRIARLKVVGWVAELEQRCRLLLHVADGGIGSPWTRHCVHHSDFVLLVGLGAADPRVGDYERLLLTLKTTARKELVLLHEARACPTGVAAAWLKPRPWVHAHHHIQMPLPFDDGDDDGRGAVSRTLPDDGLLDRHHHHPRRPHRSPHVPQQQQQPPAILGWLRALMAGAAPPQRVLPGLAHSGLGRIRTSLEKYYRRLTHGKRPTPAAYRGHRSDFARLARYLCGKSVGVVLSGGGARGIALLGVLQAFEEAGIPVDMVGGTSIGAFMAGLYAQTPDSVSIHGPLKAFSRRMSSMWRFLLDVTYPILAYTSGREFNRAIWTVFKDTEIEDLWLPFYCMTANITRSRSETHTSGLLWRVVRASMSLGGFVPPMCDANGDLLVDGGYLDNLPVQVMKSELGASMIFAVDISGRYDTSAVHYGASVSGFRVLLNHLNPFRSYRIPTLSEVQSRLTYASSDRELESAKIADSCVYLRVPPRNVGVLDFGRFDELYRRGYEYAREWTANWQRAGLLDQWRPANPRSPVLARPSRSNTAPPAAFRHARRNSI
ncbi:phosphatidylcholine and lysophosphatidylcholine phospholipase [Coemansia javaensis]|uniref:Lysophospholipase NTE1 n=1 Tax=Coemansia javaensis TaxID=2761396 RepID=A0A9W8LH45_9FUNG|nr:phosphatidylcholine and lysophosphatidylcholine phospholipase [Coemansia javaensis]